MQLKSDRIKNNTMLALSAIAAVTISGCAQLPATPAASSAPAPAAGVTAPVAAPAVAAAPAAPPVWAQGRSAAMASSTLAPMAGKMTVTDAADIPINKVKLPAGFKAEIWATGIPGARAMAMGDNGKIYVGTRAIGRVYEVTDNGRERSSRVVVDKLVQPAGVAYRDGALYVMAINKVLRYDGIAAKPDVQPVDLTAKFNLPPLQHHNWKYIGFGPDNKLYVPFGAPCNICEPGAEYAQMRRYNADGSGMEVVGRGIRNSVGFDWHPVTKEMWFTDHGRDWMGEEGPEDELNRMSATNQNFGFPYCHNGNVQDADFKKDGACNGVAKPEALMGPHAAAMGIHFYTGTMFPAEYKNMAFIARKGSWNRTKKAGYDVVVARAGANGANPKIEPFMTGFMDEKDNSFWGRPAYVAQMKDGSLLISDEQLGAIYRISYAK